MNINRLLIGLIVSPLVPAFCISIYSLLVGDRFNNYDEFAFFGTIISYILMFFIGLPLHLELEAKNIENFISYAIGGAIIGMLILMIPMLLIIVDKGILKILMEVIIAMLIGLGYGTTIASSFWVIVKG